MNMTTEFIDITNDYTYLLPQLEINNESMYAWYYQDNLFTPEECQQIIDIGHAGGTGYGKIHGVQLTEEELIETRNVQNSAIKPNPETDWIFERISQVIMNANKSYCYDIIGLREGIQFLHYDKDGHYTWHKDTGGGVTSTRKLSAIVQLTDPDTYDGCTTEIYDGGILVGQDQGSVTVFPSFMNHKVHPHLGGAPRNALAIWVYGPPFK